VSDFNSIAPETKYPIYWPSDAENCYVIQDGPEHHPQCVYVDKPGGEHKRGPQVSPARSIPDCVKYLDERSCRLKEPKPTYLYDICQNDSDADGDCHLCTHLVGKCKEFKRQEWLKSLAVPNEQVKHHLKWICKDKEPCPAFIRCLNMLSEWQGLHHIDARSLEKNDCRNRWCEINEYGGASMATVDGDKLTRLVLLAHEHCIRVDIGPCNMRYVKITLYPRDIREGSNMDHHPTIDEVYFKWRESRPIKKEY
jgi:hypothetical protein